MHRRGEGVDMARSAGDGLGEHEPSGVEHGRREVPGLPNDGGEGGPLESGRLLVRHRHQPAPQYLQRDRVEAAPHDTLTSRFPNSSTRPEPPGPTIMVDSRSSITAGPSIVA